MIQVKNITKRFGTTVAVDGVSFDVPQGQVVGFLGPNGAGKSTTMRVLTGYLPPDDGEAQILGIDLSNSLAIRRRLGYIPENNPLPEDIEVTWRRESSNRQFTANHYGVANVFCTSVDIVAFF